MSDAKAPIRKKEFYFTSSAIGSYSVGDKIFTSSTPASNNMTAMKSITLKEHHHNEELNHLMLTTMVQADVANAAAEEASRRLSTFYKKSNLLEPKNLPVPLVWEDIIVERLLGVGGFACVSLAQIPTLEDSRLSSHDDTNTKCDDENNNINYTLPSLAPQPRFAVKCLNKKSMMCPTRFVGAVKDLVYESSILSRLQHENIVELYAISSSNNNICDASLAETFQQAGGYFMVLQSMKHTLEDLLWSWDLYSKGSPSHHHHKSNNGTERVQLVPWKVPSISERLSQVAVGVAKAMDYLHSNRVIYRDLKPCNVGIDQHGVVRIFDFGIARELPSSTTNTTTTTMMCNKDNNNNWVKGCVGSLRYMAPEVLIEKQSTFASDVYSFGILLWHLLSLKKPYGDRKKPMKSITQYKKYVGNLNLRPSIRSLNKVPGHIKSLIEDCWNSDPMKRPNFQQVLIVLEHNEVLWDSSLSSNKRIDGGNVNNNTNNSNWKSNNTRQSAIGRLVRTLEQRRRTVWSQRN